MPVSGSSYSDCDGATCELHLHMQYSIVLPLFL
jgi:hypothetical protein